MPFAISAFLSALTKKSVGLSTETARVTAALPTGIEPRSTRRRLPGADDAQIAVEAPVGDGAAGHDTSRIRKIPAEPIISGGERHDFHVGRRHQQRVGVAGIQRVAAAERSHVDTPDAVLEPDVA